MDNSKSRKSDAAATRKRRSSILKSQRAPRAPLSELEFNVATPQDQAKSRRVSFSRRTGVAEFEINEATTAWKNVYEEHNKSVETSGNESGSRPRRVQHLGGRTAALFQDAEAELVGDDDVGDRDRPSLELSLLTERRTTDVFRLVVDASRPPTDRLDIDFSAVAPLDDLDALQRDLDAERRDHNMSEYNIDVDFNATHFTLRDDSDDMSITDSVHSPRVAAADSKLPDWTVDKENIVVNPYVAPPPADFANDECDDILVFDGKKCKFQSNLSDDELVKPSNASLRKTIVNDTDVSDKSLGLGVGERTGASKTVFFDDIADMTVTQAVPAQILPQKVDLGLGDDERVLANETRRQTIVYGNDADISVTQAVPVNIITPIQIACDDSNIVSEKQKTMYFDNMADISVTQTLPANIIQREPEYNNERDAAVKRTAPFSGQRDARATLLGPDVAQPHADRRRTIVYGNDDGDLSVTGALPANILDKEETKPNTARRTTIVYANDDCDVSITGVVPANIMVDRDAKPAQSENARRRTIVYGNDDGDISMTGVVPANIIVDRDEAKLAEPASTDRRKTIVYGNDDGNISMTGVVPAHIMVNRNEEKRAQPASTDRRRTIVYGNDEGNISMTGVVPANIMVDREAILAQTSSTDRRKTIVYGNEDGNLSVTRVVPTNIMVNDEITKPSMHTTTERRKTVVFGNDDGNLSVTRVVPTNIMVNDEITKPSIHATTERRKTVVFGNDDGNVSMTGVVPANIILEQIKSTEEIKTTDRRKTIVYGNDDGNISVTGVVPANIIVDEGESKLPESISNERRKTIVYGNDDGEISMTGVVPANIMVDKDGTNQTQPTNTERRRTVTYGNYDCDVPTTRVVPAHIAVAEELEDGAKLVQPTNTERRRTVVYGNDDGDISMTGVVPADIIVDDRVHQSQHTHTEHRKTVVDGNDEGNVSMKGIVPATDPITEKKEDKANPTQPATERRKTILYGNDEGDLSMTGVVPVNVTADIGGANQTQPIRRKTIVYGNDEGNLSMTGVVPANVTTDIGGANQTQPIRRKTIVYENDEGNLSRTGVVPANVTTDIGGANQTQPIRRKTIVYGNDEGNLSITGVVPANVTTDIGGANQTQPIRRKTIVYGNDEGDLSMTGVVPVNVTADIGGANQTQPTRRKTIVYGNDEGDLSMTGVVPVNVTADIGGANQTQPTRRKTIVYGNDEGNLSMTGVVPVNVTEDIGGANQTQPTRRKTILYENDEGNLSLTGVVPVNVTADIGGANQTQPTRRKTIVYGNDEGNLSMTGVVPANVTTDIGGANQTQPIRRKTIVYDNDEANLSMTGVVPANVTTDIGGANQTQPIPTERRKTVVYDNEGGDISMTGFVTADIIEKPDRATNTERRKTVVSQNDDDISMTEVVQAPIMATKENEDAVEIITETIDYGDEGDVSMTEVETRSHSLCRGLTQPIEPEEIISEDKNDQVSMTAVPRSPSVRSRDDISMQTSVKSRQSLVNLTYGDLSHNKTSVSTFHKSPGKVVVYEASMHGGEIAKTQEDRGSLSTYGNQEDNIHPQKSPVTSPEFDALSLSNRVSKIEVQSHTSDDFQAMCTSTIDAFTRSLAANKTPPGSDSLTPDSISMLDPLSRTDRANLDEMGRSLGPDRTAFDALTRSLAPDRFSILEELSPQAVVERVALSRSPPVSVLDALLDMSSMHDELDMSSMDDELDAAPSRVDSAATVAPAVVKDSDDEAIDVDDADEGDDRDVQTSDSKTMPEYEEDRGLGDQSQRFSERRDRSVYCEESPKKEDTRVETEDVERDEGNQTQWPTSCVGTQADDTRAILDALDRFTDSGDFVPRRSIAPDRRSMVRSREDLLKDISMAQALMKTEMEESDSTEEEEAEPSPPRARASGEVVKTLRFDDDSVLESPLRKPTPMERESRRATVIPPYPHDVGEIKDLMEELVKPIADAPVRAPARHSGAQTDRLPSSQIDLPGAQAYRVVPTMPPAPPVQKMPPRDDSPGEAEKSRARTLSPLARAAVLVFDRHNPLNNVALPPAAGLPHKYSPGGVAACASACPSLEPRATQTDAPPRGKDGSASPTRRQSRASRRDGDESLRDVSLAAVDPRVSHAAVDPRVSHAAVDTRVSHAAVDTREHAVFAAYAMKHEHVGPDVTPMDADLPLQPRSPPRVAFKLSPTGARAEGAGPGEGAEPGEGAGPGEGAEPEARKRGHTPADPRHHELTPKPAIKVQRISTSPTVPRRRSASPSARSGADANLRARSPSDVTVQQLLSEFNLSESTASSVVTSLARTASLLAARSAADDDDAGADVVNRISMLPFMGTECSWEGRSGDTWSFRLLRTRLRLVVRLAHGVRRAHAHTPVVLAVVQHAHQHDENDPVAVWCVRLAAEALQQLVLNTRRAGALPDALRRGVALCRCALRWARALHHARAQLAFSLDDSGLLALKVANIPLRCVWEVTLRVELVEGGAAGAWPRAGGARVARVVAAWAPRQQDVDALLAPLPRDWGHVPRAVWKIFKYLKNKRLEDDDLLLGA